jgi:hypothetical protein
MCVNWQFIKAIPEPRLLLEGRNVLSLKKSTCDRNQAVNNEPHSEQLFRRTNNIAPINQEALSS